MPASGSILLGEVAQHLASVDVACNFCPRVGKASITRLMHEHGPDMPIPTLLRLLSADCPRRLAQRIAEPCGVHLPELADVFVPGRHDRSGQRTEGGRGLMPNETTRPMRMASRCPIGRERFHAVSSGHPWTTAICGVKPRQRGNGWSKYVGDGVTCPRCLAKLARTAS
jgi:hypothetical protein